MDHSWYDEQTYGASQDPVQTTMMEVRFPHDDRRWKEEISHVELC